MTPVLWIGVFIVSLIALIKGSDWVLDGAKKIGLWLRLSPFVVGVLIVGFGTSAPELASSIAGVLNNVNEIPVANVIGSNIANILLIIGIAALVSRSYLAISKDIVDVEIPLFVISTLVLLGVIYDGTVTRVEAVFLLIGFVIYVLYNFFYNEDELKKETESENRSAPSLPTLGLLVLGFILLIFGAQYLVQSVLALSQAFNIAIGVITILAVAVGTSLPEFFVSVKAALSGDSDISVGNIFGSNAFNALVVVGIPGLIANLTVDTATMTIGIPVFIATSLIFAFSGLSRKIHLWEGAFYLLIYALFTAKLFGLV